MVKQQVDEMKENSDNVRHSDAVNDNLSANRCAQTRQNRGMTKETVYDDGKQIHDITPDHGKIELRRVASPSETANQSNEII